MKTAGLSWTEVRDAEGENVIDVYNKAGERLHGKANTLGEILEGCELLHLTGSTYQVTKWPEERR